jgi:hypothetical protein
MRRFVLGWKQLGHDRLCGSTDRRYFKEFNRWVKSQN